MLKFRNFKYFWLVLLCSKRAGLTRPTGLSFASSSPTAETTQHSLSSSLRRSIFTALNASREEWKQRLGNLISEADTIIFVLSPDSAASEICAWEVEEAVRLNKRILPINCRPLEDTNPPSKLRDLHYILFPLDPKPPGSGFGTGLASLITALNTDFAWLREHTRYFQRATEWNARGRAANRLLSGDDIAEAKAWAARRPKSATQPTALHLDFIRASEQEAEARSSEQRKQLEMMAAAQAERERALHQAEEALKQVADAQHKRARIRNIALVVVSVLAVVAGLLGLTAEKERRDAEQQKETAEQNRKDAEQQKKTAEQHRRDAEQQKETAEQNRRDAEAGAELGDQVSIRNLGFLYANGFGVRQDYTEARKWYEKAAATGDEIAMEFGRRGGLLLCTYQPL
jgi:TPR repeat protein